MKRTGFVVAVWFAFYLLVLLSPQLRVLKGNSDFLDKYTAGQLLLSGQGRQLYDIDVQKRAQSEILASLNSDVEFAGGLLIAIHPPFAALWYLPVVWLPYPIAVLASSVLGLSFFAAGIGRLVQFFRLQSEPDFERLVLFCLGFLPLLATLLQGQLTSIVCLFLTLAFVDLKRARDFRAGIWLALSLAKFQTIPVFLFVLLLKKQWKALSGFLLGAACLGVVSLCAVGWEGCRAYLRLLSDMPGWVNLHGLNPLKAHCLRGQMFLLFYHRLPGLIPWATWIANVAILVFLMRAWRGPWNAQSPLFDLKFATAILVGLLVAPQVNYHDLAFLLLPGLILFHHTGTAGFLRQSRIRLTLFLVGYPLQLLAFVGSSKFPLQFNVIGLLILGGLIVEELGRASDYREPALEAAP